MLKYRPLQVKAPKDWKYSSFHRYVRGGVYEAEWGADVDVEFETTVWRIAYNYLCLLGFAELVLSGVEGLNPTHILRPIKFGLGQGMVEYCRRSRVSGGMLIKKLSFFLLREFFQ